MFARFFNLIQKFLELVRFSHTLFALPFAIGSMFYAAQGFPTIQQFALILLAMITARNSAMAFNRLIDAKFDAQNPRTAKRHIPAGKLSPNQVKIFIGLNGIAFVAVAGFLNSLALWCAFPVWVFLLSYSYWKRFSWLCHAFLGIAIGLSPLGAWIAIQGNFALFPALLGLFLALWITGFDIIYASQDIEADRELGLKSIPVKFGVQGAFKIAQFVHLAMYIVGVVIGLLFAMGMAWWSAMALTLLALLYIHFWRKSNDLDAMNRDFFLANVLISVTVFIGLILEVGLKNV